MTDFELQSKLKKCPFCGNKNITVYTDYYTRTPSAYLTCRCGVRTKPVGISLEYSVYDKLLELWNTRYTEEASDGKPTTNTYSAMYQTYND